MKRTSMTPSFSNAPSTKPATTAPQPAQPQATTPTAARASGKMYTSASGYSFNSPAGWNLQGQENGGYSFLRAGQQTVLSVSPHAYPTIQAILNDIYDQNDAASNTNLKVRKERYGSNGVLATYEGTMQGTPVVLTILSLLSPYGVGSLSRPLHRAQSTQPSYRKRSSLWQRVPLSANRKPLPPLSNGAIGSMVSSYCISIRQVVIPKNKPLIYAPMALLFRGRYVSEQFGRLWG